MALHIVNTIVENKLCVDISAIGDSDSYDGWSGPDSSQALRNLRSWPMDTGPGMLVKSYLPTNDTLSEKMKKLLKPEFPTRAEMEIKARELRDQSSGSTVVDREDPAISCTWLVTEERRVMHQILDLDGVNIKGSHFPLCFYTKNTGYTKTKRKDRRTRAHRHQWYPWMRSHGGGASVGAEPAKVELPTHASGMTNFYNDADDGLYEDDQ